MVWPTVGSRTAKEQNRTEPNYFEVIVTDIPTKPQRFPLEMLENAAIKM